VSTRRRWATRSHRKRAVGFPDADWLLMTSLNVRGSRRAEAAGRSVWWRHLGVGRGTELWSARWRRAASNSGDCQSWRRRASARLHQQQRQGQQCRGAVTQQRRTRWRKQQKVCVGVALFFVLRRSSACASCGRLSKAARRASTEAVRDKDGGRVSVCGRVLTTASRRVGHIALLASACSGGGLRPRLSVAAHTHAAI